MEELVGDTPVFYCTGRTCSLTGLCIQVHEELKEHLPAEQISEHSCMKMCKRGGAFSIYGHLFASQDLDHLGKIIPLLNLEKDMEIN